MCLQAVLSDLTSGLRAYVRRNENYGEELRGSGCGCIVGERECDTL
jgi:hypothetical protein